MKIMTVASTLLLGAVLLSLDPVAQAQPVPRPIVLEGRARNNQYAVKLVCGEVSDRAGKGALAMGQYFTAINLHNPGRATSGVDFIHKLALSSPGERPGLVSRWVPGHLGADQATELDCRDIWKVLDLPPNTLLGGWVVFEVAEGTELDIVGVYTTGAIGGGGVPAFHTERVLRRALP